MYLLSTNHFSRLILGDLRLNDEIANLCSQFKAELVHHYDPKDCRKRRKTKIDAIGISDNDFWIACTALHHNLIVVSTDSDFPRMKEVMDFPLESWL